jgi:hypothetical protein
MISKITDQEKAAWVEPARPASNIGVPFCGAVLPPVISICVDSGREWGRPCEEFRPSLFPAALLNR